MANLASGGEYTILPQCAIIMAPRRITLRGVRKSRCPIELWTCSCERSAACQSILRGRDLLIALGSTRRGMKSASPLVTRQQNPIHTLDGNMRAFLVGLAIAWLATVSPASEKSTVSSPPGDGIVVENSRAKKVVTLSAADLAKLKQAEVKVGTNQVSYTGIPVSELLRLADVAWGGNCSPLLNYFVVIEAADGYRAVFSVPEIAPELAHKAIILADRCDGRPLAGNEGPYKIIEQDANQHGRWICQVTKISLLPLPMAASQPTPSSSVLAPAAPGSQMKSRGRIYLVGMGPGDAELVTIQAARVLKEADRVYCFDYLKEEVARYVPPERLSAVSFMLLGRLVGQNEKDVPENLRVQVRQSAEELSRFLSEVRQMVAEGKTLAFADAGDPTIYCPWSWVLEKFADLSPTVVAGLSSFNAGNAALRQNITRHSGSILLTTGDDLGTPDSSGRLKATLVIFTMAAKVQDVVPRLAARYPADTPIAVVCEASYPSEKVIFATLGTILHKLSDAKLPHLYLIYVGDGLAPVGVPDGNAAGCACGKK